MGEGFILVLDSEIYETASLAVKQGDFSHPCVQVFSKAWLYKIDTRRRAIQISGNLETWLIDSGIKSPHRNRLALWNVATVRPIIDGCNHIEAQLKLASKLSIEEDVEVYYVTDNPQKQQLLKTETMKIINSEEAVKLLQKK